VPLDFAWWPSASELDGSRLMDAERALAGPTVRDDVVVADAHI
jgi:hypothetical protein